jgi:hypothetical protein
MQESPGNCSMRRLKRLLLTVPISAANTLWRAQEPGHPLVRMWQAVQPLRLLCLLLIYKATSCNFINPVQFVTHKASPPMLTRMRASKASSSSLFDIIYLLVSTCF